jgi:hypothetical protein
VTAKIRVPEDWDPRWFASFWANILNEDATQLAGDGLAVDQGQIILPDTGTPGTYTKVTTDAKGRVTAGDVLADADIPATIARDSEVAVVAGDVADLQAMFYSGSGDPEGAVTASVPAFYVRTDTSPWLYVKTSGTGNTGWQAV